MTEQRFGHSFREVHGDDTSIERHRRVISEAVHEAFEIDELADPTTGRRMLVLPRNSPQVRLHEQLSERYIPVFPVIDASNDRIYLSLPPDARTLQSSLQFVARDIEHYGTIFQQLGQALGRCQASGVGLPYGSERSVLSGVVYSSDPADPYGSGLRLAPPYLLDTSLGKVQEMQQLHDELGQSGRFTQPGVDYLLQEVSEGWNSVRA